MKIVMINGSPRHGNVYAAINALREGAEGENTVEILEASKLNVSPCNGCNACECYKGCVATDDSNAVVDKLVAADMIVFGTPVYWWGMSAQLKTIIDKCYCKGALVKGKKIGIVVCGGAPTDDEEYELIRSQFECMAEFLNWDIRFFKAYYAMGKDSLAGDEKAVAEFRALAEKI